MSPLEELIATLSGADDASIVSRAAERLAQPKGWASSALGLLRSLPERQLFEDAAAVRVPKVQPQACPIHVEPGRFMIVLNYYDRAAFDAELAAGIITPHYHHFSFGSRLLAGAFYHITYRNDGELDAPRLEPDGQTWLRAGDVFELPFDRYHCVLAPVDGTVSLMVRGKAEFANRHIGDPAFTPEQAAMERRRLLGALERLEVVTPIEPRGATHGGP